MAGAAGGYAAGSAVISRVRFWGGYGNAAAHGPAYRDSRAGCRARTDADSYAGSRAHGNADADPGTDGGAHAAAAADPHADPDAGSDRHADPGTDIDPGANPYATTAPYTAAHPYANGYARANTYAPADSGSDRHADAGAATGGNSGHQLWLSGDFAPVSARNCR